MIRKIPVNQLAIYDWDQIIPKDEAINLYENVPQHFSRTLIAGNTGCGKTTVLLTLLYKYMHYEAVFLYYKNRTEDKYQAFTIFIEEINKRRRAERKKKASKLGLSEDEVNEPKDILLYVAHDLNDVLELSRFEEDKELRDMTKIAVFDDFLNEKDQKIVSDYMIYSRKLKFSCFYLGQTIHKVPQVIRSNCSDMIFFKHPKRELNELYKSYGGVLGKDDFEKLFNLATSKKHGFLYIRVNAPSDDMYRIGFSDPVPLEDDDED